MGRFAPELIGTLLRLREDVVAAVDTVRFDDDGAERRVAAAASTVGVVARNIRVVDL